MKELGADAAAYHREIGAHARQRGIEVAVGVGDLAEGYQPGELVGGADEAAESLRKMLRPGDIVLVKGSRAVGLERVAEKLAEEG
jgi:UDP-N-acetylmuramoyl-tripeptide--D-alanyl-D-alanine ligase